MQTEKKFFYEQLEGLRGIAVLLVISSHYLISPIFPQLYFLQLGFWGVNLFFVLSGFLITEILLRDINRGMSVGKLFKKFYARRTLRIFPVYYLVIFVMFVFDVRDSRAIAGFTLTYTYNIAEFLDIYSSLFSHFWSLCVEEQFYLIWPLLLVLVNRKQHLWLIVVMILIGLGCRLWYVGWGLLNYPDFIWLTPACFDSLGIGALLAWMKLNHESALIQLLKKHFVPLLCTISCLIIAIMAGADIASSKVFNIAARFLISVVGFFLIGAGAFNLPTYFGKLANFNFLKRIGKISYGLYIYHMIVYVLLNSWLTDNIRNLIPTDGIFSVFKYNVYIPVLLILLLLTFVISYLSYAIIEKPILKLKSRF